MKSIIITSCCALSAFLIACQPSAESEVSPQSAIEQTAGQIEQVSGSAGQDLTIEADLLAADREKLTLYKSPSCGCCQGWADRVETSFAIQTESTEDMAAVKERFGVPAAMQSCHTSVSEAGFVFEGHIPARVIEKFMANPPEGAKGLAVPGMPIGSPGMEVGDQFTPFTVYLLTDTGSTPYEQINSKSEL